MGDTGNVTPKSQVTFTAPREIDPTAARAREASVGLRLKDSEFTPSGNSPVSIKITMAGREPMKSKALKLDSRFAAGGDACVVPSQKDVHPVQP